MLTKTLPSAPSKSKPFSCRFVSITIEINDVRYAADRIEAGECGTIAFRLQKRAAGHDVYDVIRTPEGLVECSCPHYEFRLKGNSADLCKHGRALVELGLLEAPASSSPDGIGIDDPRFGESLEEMKQVFRQMRESAPCCAPAEPAPCIACAAPAVEPDPEDEDAGDPATWPAWTDSWYWTPGPAPSEAGPPVEPSPEDRQWAAAELNPPRMAPAPRGRGRSAVCAQISDRDHQRAGLPV